MRSYHWRREKIEVISVTPTYISAVENQVQISKICHLHQTLNKWYLSQSLYNLYRRSEERVWGLWILFNNPCSDILTVNYLSLTFIQLQKKIYLLYWLRIIRIVIVLRYPILPCQLFLLTLLDVFNRILIFFFCSLKLSMMTPMKRLRVKKEPKIMKKTK